MARFPAQGGNGGGVPPAFESLSASTKLAVFSEEFVARTQEAITNRFRLAQGTLGIADEGRYGQVGMIPSLATIGNNVQLDTEQTMKVSPGFAGEDWVFECVVAIQAIANTFGFWGLVNEGTQNTAVEATFLGGIGTLAGFIFDPAISSNFRIATSQGGTSTVVQTTTGPSNTIRNKLKMVFDQASAEVEFFIDEVSVGTITTNTPTSQIFISLYNANVNAISQTCKMDFVRLSSPRGTP